MHGPKRSLVNPLADQLNVPLGKRLLARGHTLFRIKMGDAPEQFALFGLCRHKRRFGVSKGHKAQIPFALYPAVTTQAMLDQDRPDVPVKIDFRCGIHRKRDQQEQGTPGVHLLCIAKTAADLKI